MEDQDDGRMTRMMAKMIAKKQDDGQDTVRVGTEVAHGIGEGTLTTLALTSLS